jgi:hypothetical protein
MTISSTVRIAGPYIGSGAATVFPFAFKVFAAAEMQVAKLNTTSNVEIILVLNTDYTVQLNGDQNGTPGGTITLPAVLASGFNLTITSDIANLQPTDLTNQGGFYPEVITDALDRATIQIQQLDQNSRAIKIPLSDGVLDMTTPVVSARQGKYLAFDSLGLPVVSSGTGSDSALRTDLANATAVSAGSRLSGFRQDGTGATARTVDAKLKDTVSVKDFGAVGDGSTNDTDAFAAACTYLNAQGGGKLIIPQGTYIVGKQTLSGAFGLGGSYIPASIISFSNCTKPVVVEGNGSILKVASGLRFGSFNPVTGAAYFPVLPFYNSDYVAGVGIVVKFNQCQSAIIRDLEIDGNIQNLVLGGLWGDTGRQIAAYGVWTYASNNFLAENIYTHHHALDGVVVGYTGLTEISPQYPHTLINVVSSYNARQGLSWVGGTQLTALNCVFSNTGQSTFTSSPSAGLDIEAESSVCRNGLFINCEMQNNSGPAMVADSGDSADVVFIRCKFVGQNNYAIWANKPRLSFTDCSIIGVYVNSYYSILVPEDATKYIRCLFSDEVKYAATLYLTSTLGNVLSATNVQNNVLYDKCAFITTRTRPGVFNFATIKNCEFRLSAGTTITSNQDYFAIFDQCLLENNVILDDITTNIPADAYYASLSSAKSVGRNLITSASSKLKWWTWSSGGGGYKGYLGVGNNNEIPQAALSVIAGTGSALAGYYGSKEIYFGTAFPVTGTFKQGDKVFNSAPIVGQPKGWICTVAGSPGTWVSEGNL